MGFAREEATNMTGEFMHVIGALTNFNSGTETAESVSAKFSAALTGELSGLKSLGIQLDADTVKQKAVEMGLAATTKEVGKQEIAQVVLAEAYKQSGDALAAYNEESLDAKTRFGLLKSQIADTAATMGSKFLPVVNNSLGALKNGFEKAIPFIEKATDGLLDMIDGVEGGSEKFKTNIKSMLDGMVKGITDILPKMSDIAFQIVMAVTETILQSLPILVDLGAEILYNFMGGIAQNLPNLLNTISEVVVGIIDQFLSSATDLIDMGIWILEALIEGIIQAVPKLLEQIPMLVDKIVNVLMENIPRLVLTGGDLVLQLIDGILAMLPTLVEMVPQLIDSFINTIIENFPYILETGIEVLLRLIDGIINALPQLIAAVPQIINSIVNTLVANLPQILKMGIEIIVKLVAGLIQAIPKLIGAVPQIMRSLIDAYKSYLGNFVNIGKNIVEGLWNGITSMGRWIADKVSGFFSGIVDKAKSVLGIHSPSRVFRDQVGKYMAEGVGVGFENEMDTINADIEKSLNSTVKVASETEIPQVDNGIGQVVALLQKLLEKDTTIELDGRMVGRGLAPYKDEIDRFESRNVVLA